MQTLLLINGQLVAGEGAVQPVLNPSLGTTLVEIAEASPAQVDAAVRAADDAFALWSQTSPKDRSTLLLKLADAIDAQAEELARLESQNCGKPFAAALNDEIGNDAMERQSVIKPLPGQIHKILHRDGRFFLIELRLHVAFFSRNNRVFHRKFNKLISSLPLAPSDSQLLRNIPVPEFPAHDTEAEQKSFIFKLYRYFPFRQMQSAR
mgnify:CR=1 FL=1